MKRRRVRFSPAFERSYLKFPAEARQVIDAAIAAFIDRIREHAGEAPSQPRQFALVSALRVEC
jgi:hypothetical protein